MIALRTSSLFLLGITVVSCTVGYPPVAYDQDLLVDFPLLPHTEEVPVYFPQDTLPNKEYVRVGVLESYGGEFTSYNELIRRMQLQAQERGVDAVQLMNKEVEATEYYGASTLTGIGMKYLENLDYLSDFVKAQEIYLPSNSIASDTNDWIAKIHFDFDYRILRTEGNDEYSGFVKKYSLNYLLFDQSRPWRYAPDEYGRARMRVRKNADSTPQLRVWFSYQAVDRPNFIRIKEYPNRTESTVWLAYDAEGKMLKKRITLASGEIIDQIFIYDSIGRNIKSEFYQVTPDQKMIPYLVVKQRFYSPEDIQQRLVLK